MVGGTTGSVKAGRAALERLEEVAERAHPKIGGGDQRPPKPHRNELKRTGPWQGTGCETKRPNRTAIQGYRIEHTETDVRAKRNEPKRIVRTLYICIYRTMVYSDSIRPGRAIKVGAVKIPPGTAGTAHAMLWRPQRVRVYLYIYIRVCVCVCVSESILNQKCHRPLAHSSQNFWCFCSACFFPKMLLIMVISFCFFRLCSGFLEDLRLFLPVPQTEGAKANPCKSMRTRLGRIAHLARQTFLRTKAFNQFTRHGAPRHSRGLPGSPCPIGASNFSSLAIRSRLRNLLPC